MSYSTYVSTPQTTNAARLSRVVGGPCTDLLRDVLQWRIPETDFPNKLQLYEHSIKHRLSHPQRGMLYPQPGPCIARYADFDISLLYVLLRNACGIRPHCKGWGYPPDTNDYSLSAHIDRLREIRNEYCGHSPLTSLSDLEFSLVWDEVRQIVQDLEFHISGPSVKYVKAVDVLKTMTMDPEQEQIYLEEIDRQKEEDMATKKVVESIREEQVTQGAIQKRHSEILSKQSEIQTQQTEILSQQVKMNEVFLQHSISMSQKLERMQTQEGDTLTPKDLMLQQSQGNPEAAKIFEVTNRVLKNHGSSLTFFHTTTVTTAIDLMKKHQIVIITGLSGEGKTTVSHQIMSLMSPGYTPAILQDPCHWDKVVDTDKKMIVFLVDFVGKTNLDRFKFENWKHKFPDILSSAQKGNVYVIIEIRENILTEIRKIYSEQQMFNNEYEINISSIHHRMTKPDRKAILDKYQKACQYKTEDFEGDILVEYVYGHDKRSYCKLDFLSEENAISSDQIVGFPQTCHLFFAKKEFYQLGSDFFIHPSQVLHQDIEKMRTSQKHLEQMGYCILAFVLIYHKMDIKDTYKDCVNFVKLAKRIGIQCVKDYDVKDALEKLLGPYLSISDMENCYKFSHETVRDAVLMSFGQLATITVIKQCSRSTLYELIRTEKCIRKPGENFLQISKCYYPVLVDKLFTVNTDRDGRFSADDFLICPITEDAAFASAIFIANPGHHRMKLYRRILKNVHRYNRPDLIDAMLKYVCQDNTSSRVYVSSDTSTEVKERKGHDDVEEEEYLLSEDIAAPVPNMESYGNQFVVTDGDICNLLRSSISSEVKENVISICRFINSLPNAIEYYTYKHIELDNKMTVLYQCAILGWDDVIADILIAHAPSIPEIGQTLDKLFSEEQKQAVITMCQCINRLSYANEYYEHARCDSSCLNRITPLQYCATLGWVDVINFILDVYIPTQHDMRRALDISLKYEKRQVVFTLCLYISRRNAEEYLCCDDQEEEEDDDDDSTGSMVLQFCFSHRWYDIVEVILTVYTPTPPEICRFLNKGIKDAERDLLLILCRCINRLWNAYVFYERKFQYDEDDEDGSTILQCCVTHGWDDVIDIILGSVFVTRVEVCHALYRAISDRKRQVVYTLCRYINTLRESDEYYCINVDENDDLGSTVFECCSTQGWDDILGILLTDYIPSRYAIRRALHEGIKRTERNVVLTLCRHINDQQNPTNYYKRYDDDDDWNYYDIGSKVLRHCVKHGWDDVINAFLPSYTPTQYEICRAFDKGIKYGERNVVLILCSYINKYRTVENYYDRYVDNDDDDYSGFTVLQCCFLREWDEIVDEISTKYIPTRPEICLALDQSIKCAQGNVVFTLCHYINRNQDNWNVNEFYKRYFQYDDDRKDGDDDGGTLFWYCVTRGWHDVVDVILAVYEPEKSELFRALDKGINYEKSDMMITLCNFINNLSITDLHGFYRRNVKCNNVSDPEGTLIQCCVANGWDDAVKKILNYYSPKKSEMCCALDTGIKCEKRRAVLTLCRFINCLSNSYEYYNRILQNDGKDCASTILQFCVAHGWDDVVDVILTCYKPTQHEMFRALDISIKYKQKPVVFTLCQYVSSLSNAFGYYRRNVRDDDGSTILQCCATRGWDEVVENILTVYKPTQHKMCHGSDKKQ